MDGEAYFFDLTMAHVLLLRSLHMKTKHTLLSEPVLNQEETITMFVQISLPSQEKTDPAKEIPIPKETPKSPETYIRRYHKGR